ncbi:hypothetical protein TEPIDINF_000585 [Tepidibacillus infernus]|uniref:Uncharacterized protein n=1 Tax=Tepidibacillus decaturensis TaxID=1413211 RepID=A0A135L2N9_9BACI|nr:hypothetical protein [Tepidibacillus decaturensis]KXG43232.1 hypothetical protein U473_03785 [Tepidibacillus decaturensis]
MVKKLFSTLIILALMIASFGGVTFAKGKPLTEKQVNQIKANFGKAGIDQETQLKLIEKIENGEILGANNPKMKDKGKIKEKKFIDKNGIPGYEKKIIYPDGSVDITSVSGGTSRTGSGYVNYIGRKVSRLSGGIYASFLADYTNVQYGYDSLDRVYEWYISGVSDISNITLTVAQSKETSSSDAYGYLRFTGSAGGYYTSTFYLKLFVGNDTDWDSGNW